MLEDLHYMVPEGIRGLDALEVAASSFDQASQHERILALDPSNPKVINGALHLNEGEHDPTP